MVLISVDRIYILRISELFMNTVAGSYLISSFLQTSSFIFSRNAYQPLKNIR